MTAHVSLSPSRCISCSRARSPERFPFPRSDFAGCRGTPLSTLSSRGCARWREERRIILWFHRGTRVTLPGASKSAGALRFVPPLGQIAPSRIYPGSDSNFSFARIYSNSMITSPRLSSTFNTPRHVSRAILSNCFLRMLIKCYLAVMRWEKNIRVRCDEQMRNFISFSENFRYRINAKLCVLSSRLMFLYFIVYNIVCGLSLRVTIRARYEELAG